MTNSAENIRDAAKAYFELLRTELENLTSVASPQAAAFYNRTTTLLTEIENLDDETFAAVYESVKDNPLLPIYPTVLQESRKALEIVAAIPPAAADPVTNRACDSNCSEPDCGTYPTQTDVDAAKLAVATLDLLTAIAEAAMVMIPQEALGIPNPAYFVAAALYGGLNIDAKIAAEAAAILELQYNKIANCIQDAYNTMLRFICCNTEEIIQKLDYLISLAEYIKKIVDIINLRQIEEILASCKTLTSLYLPAAFGGHLEEVAALVQLLIDQSKAAGLNTCDAQAFFYLGLSAIADGAYKKAYQWFTEAYQQLICC